MHQCRFIYKIAQGCTFNTTLNYSYIFHIFKKTTGWTVRGWNPGGGEILRTRPNRL